MKDNVRIIYEKISHFDAQIKYILNNIHKLYYFFKLIFDDKIIGKIVSKINDYKNSSNENEKKIGQHREKLIKSIWIKTNKMTRSERMGKITIEKLGKYIGCIILMSIINLPEYSDYWDDDPLLENSVNKIIILCLSQ